MNITAKLIVKEETQTIGDSFRKREFVLEYAENPTYPELIKFEFIQDKCELLDAYNVGQNVTVDYNLKGRKWTDPKGVDKYFNTLQAWRISADNGTHDVTPEHTSANNIASGVEVDDLPFVLTIPLLMLSIFSLPF